MLGIDRVGVLKYTFDDVSLRDISKVKRGKFGRRETWYSLHFEMRMKMSPKAGVLQFDVCYEGEKCGTADIDFERGDEPSGSISGSSWTGDFSDLSVNDYSD